MVVIEDENQIYDSTFALMTKYEDEDDDKVNILYIKYNLKDYTLKELKYLTNVLMDTVWSH